MLFSRYKHLSQIKYYSNILQSSIYTITFNYVTFHCFTFFLGGGLIFNNFLTFLSFLTSYLDLPLFLLSNLPFFLTQFLYILVFLPFLSKSEKLINFTFAGSFLPNFDIFIHPLHFLSPFLLHDSFYFHFLSFKNLFFCIPFIYFPFFPFPFFSWNHLFYLPFLSCISM